MEGSLRRTRLARELRRLREDHAGLSLDEVAERSDINRSALSRVETARQKARPPIVRVLLNTYGIEGEQANSLLQLAREADQRGWWSRHANALTAQHLEYISFEAKASTVMNYEVSVVPGLLQTYEYARAVMGGTVAVELPNEAAEHQAKVRIERQRRLTEENPLSLWAIVDEAALRHPVGGAEVMQAQLDHLIQQSQLPNVNLQVVAMERGAHVGMLGAFSILEFPNARWEPPAVYVDCPAGELWVEGEAELARATMTFNRLRETALDVESSRQRIRQASQELST
jgi:transcriptional regulator with XRE-family HTH domain